MSSKISLNKWMGDLPSHLHGKPLINLYIPGSHDSFTCHLDRRGPVGNDQPYWLQIVCKLLPPVKRIIYNWSRCQRLCIKEQLESGVRYLDIRLTCERGTIRTIHGLCGQDLDSLVDEVDRFLNENPKEVVLLDFNHFYNMGLQDHRKTILKLLTVFESKCCPMPQFTELGSLNLDTCWRYGWRVILFYQICFEALESIMSWFADRKIPIPYSFWTSRFIKAPWANTDRIDALIKFLECSLSHKKQILPCGGFFVVQGILTPRVKDVVLRPFSTLRDRMGIPAVKAMIEWLRRRGPVLKPNLNIIMVDFIETDDFCRNVVALNL